MLGCTETKIWGKEAKLTPKKSRFLKLGGFLKGNQQKPKRNWRDAIYWKKIRKEAVNHDSQFLFWYNSFGSKQLVQKKNNNPKKPPNQFFKTKINSC